MLSIRIHGKQFIYLFYLIFLKCAGCIWFLFTGFITYNPAAAMLVYSQLRFILFCPKNRARRHRSVSQMLSVAFKLFGKCYILKNRDLKLEYILNYLSFMNAECQKKNRKGKNNSIWSRENILLSALHTRSYLHLGGTD